MKNLTTLATVILISTILTACGGGETNNTGGGSGSGTGGGDQTANNGLIIDNGRGTSNGYETEVPH